MRWTVTVKDASCMSADILQTLGKIAFWHIGSENRNIEHEKS